MSISLGIQVRRSLLMIGLLASACSEQGAASKPDTGTPDLGVWDAGPRVAPQTAPTPVAISEWMVAMAVSPDPMRSLLEQGTFAYPEPGWDENGLHWSARTPGDSGSLGTFPPNEVAYAVARVKLDAANRYYIRSEATLRAWLDRMPYPGGYYAPRRALVPLLADGGESLLVLMIKVRKIQPEAGLWTTPDELQFNLDDLTVPDLVVGDSSQRCLGVSVLNLTRKPALDVIARVVGSDAFEETTVSYPALAAGAVTQLAFDLQPRQAAAQAGETVEATLRVESPSLQWAYERKVPLTTVAADDYHRRTRISRIDRSCQYYGVAPPTDHDPAKKYALVLSLHGAGAEALGLAKNYSRKDWAYIVTPTNRRRLGYSWEVWGRLDGIETLDHAMESFNIDPTRVYLTGHSMGGHGAWHLGVMHPGRFAVIAPSAGWISYYSYSKDPRPQGVFARTQAHSDTNNYLQNLARRGVYILHGDADESVPVSESQNMYQAVQQVTDDVVYHEEPGATHVWDKDEDKEGEDFVDWDPLLAFMRARTLDPVELDFDFKTPAPWVSPSHSYVTILSQLDANQDSQISSTHGGATVTLVTANVRGMLLDGAALQARGVSQVVVDGKTHPVTSGTMTIGAQDGKRPGIHGPFHELLYRPFCLIYPDSGADAFERYAAIMASFWSVTGNGHACAMPLSRLASHPPEDHNLIFVGVPSSVIDGDPLPASWTDSELTVANTTFSNAALYIVFPRGERIAGAVTATKGSEHLLFQVQLFNSRQVLPDYMVFSSSGVEAAGLFDAQWK